MGVMRGLWLSVAMFLSGGAMADEVSIGNYDWGRIVSAEALSQKRAGLQAAKLPGGVPTQTCRVALDYAKDDPLMAGAQIYVLLDQVEGSRWLAYEGPAQPEIALTIPVIPDGAPQALGVFVEALAADDIHVSAWTSYGAFPINCDGGRTAFRLLDEFDMAGTGGNLHVVERAQ